MKTLWQIFCLVCLIIAALYGCVANAIPVPVPQRIGIPAPSIDPARIEQQIQKPRIRSVAPAKITADIVPDKPLIKDAKKLKRFKLKGIRITGSTVFTAQDLRPLYREYLYKSIDINDLIIILNRINHKYSKAGYVLSKAVLPVQKVTNGIVRIRIIEGKICKVYIKGKVDEAARKRLISYGNKIRKSFPVRMKVMERYLLLINDLPGLTVRSVLSPDSKVVGGIDLTFIVKQQIVTASISYDDFGTRYLGPYRVMAEIAANSFLGKVDKLGARTLDSTANRSLRFGQVYYTLPIFDEGTELNFTVMKTQTHPWANLRPVKLRGISYQYRASIIHPFLRSRTKNFDISLMADWLDSDLYTEAVQPRAVIYKDNIRSLRLKGSFDGVDKLDGFNYAMLEVSKGLPGFGASPCKQTGALTSRYGGRSNYTKFSGEVFRLQKINNYLSVLIGGTGQYSWNPLLSAEEFGFGGRAYGRGYDPADLIGDSGIAGKFEIRLNTVLGFKKLHKIQYYTFCDSGKVWNLGTDSGQPKEVDATSFGFGARITFNQWISGVFELSKGLTYPVPAEVAAGKSGYDYRGFFNLTARV
jgi:hemolysin activation/secretion protein